jgi:ketosteroid isomerase-like protein
VKIFALPQLSGLLWGGFLSLLAASLPVQLAQAQGVTPSTASSAAKAASAPAVTCAATKSTEGDEEESELPKTYMKSCSSVSKTDCKIKCVDPHAACEESAKVIQIVLDMYKAYSEGDIDTLSKYLDKDCTTFDEGTKKLISGREAVLADIKSWLSKNSASVNSPLLAYTIEHPFCQVSNDQAVVTFTALKELGGDHPRKFKSRCTDIFRKDGDSWVRTHYRSNWSEIQ